MIEVVDKPLVDILIEHRDGGVAVLAGLLVKQPARLRALLAPAQVRRDNRTPVRLLRCADPDGNDIYAPVRSATTAGATGASDRGRLPCSEASDRGRLPCSESDDAIGAAIRNAHADRNVAQPHA